MADIDLTARWQGDKHNKDLWEVVFTGLIELKTLKQIVDDSEGQLPSISVVARWAMDDDMPEYKLGYQMARKIAAELRIDNAFQIAENTSNDWEDYKDENGVILGKKVNTFPIQRAKMILDTTKWFAAKMLPKLYGDRVDVGVSASGELAALIMGAMDSSRGLPEPVDAGD